MKITMLTPLCVTVAHMQTKYQRWYEFVINIVKYSVLCAIDMACDPAQHADLGAILLHEGRCYYLSYVLSYSHSIIEMCLQCNHPLM